MQQVFGVSLFFAIGVLFNLVCITNKHIATNKIISTERFNKDVSSLVVDLWLIGALTCSHLPSSLIIINLLFGK